MSDGRDGYGALVRTPGVMRIIAAQLTARLPGGMLSLALLFHLHRTLGSYGDAGAAIAALCVGQAVSQPSLSRLMARVGIRPVVICCALVSALATTVIALVPMTGVVAVTVAFITGASLPPIQSAARTIYPRLVAEQLHSTLFSLDAALQELIWIGGPVAITFVATGVGSTAGMLLPAVLELGGGLWFALSPEVGRTVIPASVGRFGTVLRRPAVLVATVVGFLVIAFCASTEASVVGYFGTGDPVSGLVLATWSIASLISGIVFGRMRLGRWSLTVRLAVVTIGAALVPLVAGASPAGDGVPFLLGAGGLSAALVVSGLGLAPTLGVLSTFVSRSVPFSESAEAFGWTGTGQLVGAAAGAAVAGGLLDRAGPTGAFVGGAALAGAAALAALAGRRWGPRFRALPGPTPTPGVVPRPARQADAST